MFAFGRLSDTSYVAYNSELILQYFYFWFAYTAIFFLHEIVNWYHLTSIYLGCANTSSSTFIKADQFKMKNPCSKKYLHFMWIWCCSKSINQNVWKFIQLPAQSEAGVAENLEDLGVTFSANHLTVVNYIDSYALDETCYRCTSCCWGHYNQLFFCVFFHLYLLSVKRRADIIQISLPMFSHHDWINLGSNSAEKLVVYPIKHANQIRYQSSFSTSTVLCAHPRHCSLISLRTTPWSQTDMKKLSTNSSTVQC